ncbi:MAG: hypothetical protein J3R72DRAFT_453283 [Linnemannia gamsii]|nr:MAG: hypothetical protein J3R72DRAFT_453283 [Linnemannia gamsii]
MEHSPLLPGTQTTKVSSKSMTVCKFVLYVTGTGVIAVAAFFTPIPAAAAAAFGIPAIEYAVSLFFGSVVVYFTDHIYKSLFKKNSLGAVEKATYDDHMDSNDSGSSQQGSTHGPSSTGSCKIAEFGTFPKGSSPNGWTSTGPPDMYASDVSVAPSPDQALEDVIVELNPGTVGSVPQQQQRHEQHQHREQQPSPQRPQQLQQQDQQQDQQQQQHEHHEQQQPRHPQQSDTEATLSKREEVISPHRTPLRGGNSNNNNNNSSKNDNSNDNNGNFRGSYVDDVDEIVF